MPVNPNFTLSL